MAKDLQQKISDKRRRLDSSAWMNQSPHPLPIFEPGQQIHVYRQSCWLAGKVIESNPGGCAVNLVNTDQIVKIYDARCLKSA